MYRLLTWRVRGARRCRPRPEHRRVPAQFDSAADSHDLLRTIAERVRAQGQAAVLGRFPGSALAQEGMGSNLRRRGLRPRVRLY